MLAVPWLHHPIQHAPPCLLDGTLSHSLRDSEGQRLRHAAGLGPDVNHSSVFRRNSSEGEEPLIRSREQVRRPPEDAPDVQLRAAGSVSVCEMGGVGG